MSKIIDDNPVQITSENFNLIKSTYQREQKVQFICSVCNKISIRPLRWLSQDFICTKCSKNNTMLERYGVKSKASLKETQDKMKQTCLERYGVDHPSKTSVVKEKLKESWKSKDRTEYWEERKRKHLEKYGVEYSFQRADVKDKIKNTNIERYGHSCSLLNENIKEKSKHTIELKYGVDNVSKSEEIKEKKKKTCRAHYGVDYYSQSDEGRKKIRESYNYKTYEKSSKTCFERYGHKNPFQVPEFKEKIIETMTQRYGFPRFRQNKELNERVKNETLLKYGTLCFTKKYKFEGLIFDSMWEAYYFKFLQLNSVKFSFHPNLHFQYTANNEAHDYFPDFDVGGQIIEIKGDQFFDELGNMINPYDRSKDYIMLAKQKCMAENNVLILTSKDIYPIIDWVNNNFGKLDLVSTK